MCVCVHTLYEKYSKQKFCKYFLYHNMLFFYWNFCPCALKIKWPFKDLHKKNVNTIIYLHDDDVERIWEITKKNSNKSFEQTWINTITSLSSLIGETNRVATPTATESVLPWKREDDKEDDGVIQQTEFPSWANNKEYLAYNSPSATFLGKFN